MPLPPLPVAYAATIFAATLLVVGCDSNKEGDNPPQQDTPTSEVPKEPEVTVKQPPKVSPTDNHLPPQLENVRIGMSLADFKAVRDSKKMGVHAFEESMVPNLNGSETDEEFMAKLDEAEKNAKRVQSPDWDGTKGLYYLDEKFEGGPLKEAKYTFRDAVLRRVIVYYDSPANALEVATGLRGKPVRPDERLTVPKKDDTPEFTTWVYKDRYVARATKDVGDEPGNAKDDAETPKLPTPPGKP